MICSGQFSRTVYLSRPPPRPCLTSPKAGPSQQNSAGKGFGAPPQDQPQSPTESPNETDAQSVEILPREKVLDLCLATSAAMAVLGVTACFATPPLLHLVGSSIESVAVDSLKSVPSPSELLVASGTGCLVTAARFALMLVWDDLKSSTDAANLQVTSTFTLWHSFNAADPHQWTCAHRCFHSAAVHLQTQRPAVMQILTTIPEMRSRDVALVASLPAATEEILFRGAVVGNLGGTPGAAALAAIIFGYLHISGPRNYASGLFAGAAGVAYGAVYITTGSVWAAAAAHVVGNLTSAATWIHTQPLEAYKDVVHPENVDR